MFTLIVGSALYNGAMPLEHLKHAKPVQLVATKKHYTMVLMFDKLLIFTVSTDDILKNGIWFKMALKSGIHSIIKRKTEFLKTES